MINFTVLPLFNLIKVLFSNASEIKNNRSLLDPIQSYFRSYFFEIRDRSYFTPKYTLISLLNFTIITLFNLNKMLIVMEIKTNLN